MLVKSPGFTAVTVLTLAFGIAATTVMLSIVNGLLLAPLPYFQPDRLIAIMQSNQRLGFRTWISYPNFRDWQHDAQSFERMTAFTWQGFDLTSPGPPQHIEGKPVSAGLFGTLGIKLALGREFTPQEDAHAGAPVVIISHHLWGTRFAKTPQILDQSLTLNGTSYAVVGVLPRNFHFFGDAEVYTPLGQGDPILLNNRAIHPGILAIARLKSGVDISHAQAELTTIQNRLDVIYPEANRYEGADVVSLKQQMVGNAGATPLMLLGAVTLVLMIACANVASLLMSRAAARKQEFAVRSALGASRAQLLRQLLVESMLLSLVGGGVGCALAALGLRPLLMLLPADLPRSEEIGVHTPVLLFTLAVSLASGILFGLAPSLKSSKPDLESSLKAGGRGLTRLHHRAQNGLVVVQIALTVVLLVSAGLLLRTIRQLWSVNPGFDAKGLVTFKVGLAASLTRTGASTRLAYRNLIDRIGKIPGVEAVDFTNLVPLTLTDNDSPFWIGTQRPVSIQGVPRLNLFFTGPNYLQTMQIPLLRGRFLTPQDDSTTSTPAVVVDSNFASTYLHQTDPIGQIITIAHWGPCRIVGVAGHVKHWGLGDTSQLPKSEPVYASFYQLPDQWVPVHARYMTVVVRTSVDAAVLMSAVKEEIYGAGSEEPIYDVHSMQEIVARSMSSQRYPMILLGAFASVALILASVGIYGVISYSIAQRTREMGIRMALGADKRNVLWMVIGQGLRLVLIGLAVGIGSAFAITRALSGFSHLLYGVRQDDPLSFTFVSLVLTVVAAVASYIPARRATKVDPMVALRYE
jgi:predicted permease